MRLQSKMYSGVLTFERKIEQESIKKRKFQFYSVKCIINRVFRLKIKYSEIYSLSNCTNYNTNLLIKLSLDIQIQNNGV